MRPDQQTEGEPRHRVPTGPARAARRAAVGLFCLMLAACADGLAPGPAGPPPGITDVPPPEPTVTKPDAETLAARAYYRQIESNYRAQGLLATDAGATVPFTAADLARNFLTLAFYDEFAETGGELVPGGGEARLHRWERPVRVAVEFGPSVPTAQRSADRAEIAGYLSRLSRITGLPMRLAALNPNFLVLVQAPPERRALGPRILRFAPGTSDAALRSALDMRADIYCTVFSYSPGQSSFYDRSLAVIRSELPDLMRRECFHEEIAQGLGLINDSPRARPSIFNDTKEFALLTRQDELMLRILYDARLKPGMTLAEAAPIVEVIAAELMAPGG
jgi:hypothetical protein